MWKKIWYSRSGQMTIWRMRSAYWIPKASDTHRLRSTYCFSTATLLTWTRLNVTLYVNSCNNDLLIYKMSSTCFGQYFAHHQERETEIFTAYGILLLWWAVRRWTAALHYVYCKTGESLPFYSTRSATLPLTVYLPTTTTGYHIL